MTGYEQLAAVLDAALAQAATGKGRERHANNRPFMDQPMMQITRMVGIGFPAGQISKKAQEAVGMAARGQHDAARAELLGAIIYAAGAYLSLPPGATDGFTVPEALDDVPVWSGAEDAAPARWDLDREQPPPASRYPDALRRYLARSWRKAPPVSVGPVQRDPGDEDDSRSTTAQALWGGLQAQPCSAWYRGPRNGGGLSVTTTEDDS